MSSPRTTTVEPGHIHRPQGGGPQPVLSEADLARAIEMAQRGMTLRAIATELFVHPTTVGRYLRGQGIFVKCRVVPNQGIDPNELLATCELAEQGYSVRDVAQMLDRHPTTIRTRLHKHARDDGWKHRAHRLADDGRLPRGA
jgi:IS30 family transposase